MNLNVSSHRQPFLSVNYFGHYRLTLPGKDSNRLWFSDKMIKKYVKYTCLRQSTQEAGYTCSRPECKLQFYHWLDLFSVNPMQSEVVLCEGWAYLSLTNLELSKLLGEVLQKLQTKQNHLFRAICFATLYGKYAEPALPFLNLLDILTVDNVYRLQTLNFVRHWDKKQLPVIFNSYFQDVKDIHSYNTRFASKNNLNKPQYRKNAGRRTVSSMATDISLDLPLDI